MTEADIRKIIDWRRESDLEVVDRSLLLPDDCNFLP